MPFPPAKRARITRSSQNWPSVESSASSSSVQTLSLDDLDEPIAPLQKRTKTTKSRRKDRMHPGPIAQPDINIPGSLFLLYESFAKTGSWQDRNGKPQCGFCTYVINNHHSCFPDANEDFSLEHARGTETVVLEFDPLLYPAQFWSHCVYYHNSALRRDLESFLKAESRKDMVRLQNRHNIVEHITDPLCRLRHLLMILTRSSRSLYRGKVKTKLSYVACASKFCINYSTFSVS